MPLANDIKSDIKAAKKIRLPWWGVLCLIFGSLPLYWLFDHFGRFNIALPTLVSIGMLGFVIAVKRNLRRHAWFWGTMAILAALHVPLILFVPWTIKWVPAVAIAAIGSADICVMLAILAAVGRFVEGRRRLNGGRRRS
jgi:ABC-type multidrug transport system permease subunit